MSTQLELLSSEPSGTSLAGRLDQRTREVGRAGLSAARTALAEANRRADERDAARLARRDDELARRAAAARRSARRGVAGEQERRRTNAA